MERGPVIFLLQKIGPYHHARLNAAAVIGPLVVIEFRVDDHVYAWAPVTERVNYKKIGVIAGRIEEALKPFNPAAVVCVGYSDREIHHTVKWASQRRVPLVVCSDSTFGDEPRTRWRESFKRRLLDVFGAGLVAGIRARDYLVHLGMRADTLFQHWDVVDNNYFAAGADKVRREVARERAARKLPQNYFLCVARFVPKKNLHGLLAAYADYVTQAGTGAWSLVLSGSGSLEDSLRAFVADHGLGERVHFIGFQQYGDLPAYYGLAGALVLPSLSDQWGLVVNEAMASGLPVLVSSRCGCADDLVEPGQNGFVFDPADHANIARHMVEISSASPERRAAMGQRSREIVARYSLQSFADGLWAAIRCAQTRLPRKTSLASRAVLALLARRGT